MASTEAVNNIATMYANTSNIAAFNKINVTDISANRMNVTDMSGNNITSTNIRANKINVTDISLNNISSNNQICINSTCLTETDLKKIIPHKKIAGFVVDIYNQTMPLYEGAWSLNSGWSATDVSNTNIFDAGTNERWDIAFVNKGWKLTFYEGGTFNTITPTNRKEEVENKDSDIPKRLNLTDSTVWAATATQTMTVTASPSNSWVSSYKAEWIGY